MKILQLIYLLAIAVAFSACGTVTVETSDNFKQVVLPDSSVVYLNHESKISYNENFKLRKVTLEGEAFFSVNDGETPFTVETESGEEVVVKGTEFFMAATTTRTVVEVEHGFVVMHVGTGIIKEVHFGERGEFNRHDNGLHLGHAKHKHRHWISLMDNNFRKSGKVLMRSRKHAGPGFHPGNVKGPKGGREGKGGPEGKPDKGGKDGPEGKGKPDGKGDNDGKNKPDGKGRQDGKGGKGK